MRTPTSVRRVREHDFIALATANREGGRVAGILEPKARRQTLVVDAGALGVAACPLVDELTLPTAFPADKRTFDCVPSHL